jgi:pimeloyl-ACP methyl ester carboxylesterase
LIVDETLSDGARYAELTTAGIDVQSVAIRYLGPDAKPHVFDRETALQYMHWYAGRSLFADRVADVFDAIRQENVRLIGRGMGALLVLYAAALDGRIKTVVCDGGLLSYRSLTQCDRPAHGANIIVRGVLRHFDLPDVAALIAPRKLVLRAPVDGMNRPVSEAVVQSLYGRSVRVVSASTPYLDCLA